MPENVIYNVLEMSRLIAIVSLQGNSCFCLAEPSSVHLNEKVDARECNIPCPGNEREVCGGSSTFTYYRYCKCVNHLSISLARGLILPYIP